MQKIAPGWGVMHMGYPGYVLAHRVLVQVNALKQMIVADLCLSRSLKPSFRGQHHAMKM